MAAAQEEVTFGAKISPKLMKAAASIALILVGAAAGSVTTGAKAPPDPQPLATIGAVTSAAESRAQGVALSESAKLRTDVQTDLARHRGELTEALNRMAAIQTQQAATLSDVRSAVARIEGRLDAVARRR